MNWRQFGRLVQSLRQALSADLGHPVRQADLERECGFQEHTGLIGRIERGEIRCMKPEILLPLANALHLTRWERREFFLAGTGIETDQIYIGAPDLSPEEELARLEDRLARILLPAFIVDPFGDIVAVNRMMQFVYEVSPKDIEAVQRGALLPNVLYLAFSSRFRLFERLATSSSRPWNEVLLSMVKNVRWTSLQYRTTRYWEYLFDALWNAPDRGMAERFRRYWKMASAASGVDGNFTRIYQVQHSRLGLLEFLAAVVEEITGAGPLYVVVYLPLSSGTQKAFETFSQFMQSTERPVVRLARWPLEVKEQWVRAQRRRPRFF